MTRETDASGENKSKSQAKREQAALQKLGEQLLTVPDSKLEDLPISEELRVAVQAARGFKREALRRQMQFIGVLMRREDEPVLREALSGMQHERQLANQAMHEAEHWRDELLAGNTELIGMLGSRFPRLDRQHLRQLVRNARQEQQRDKPPKSARLLYRYLHDQLTDPR